MVLEQSKGASGNEMIENLRHFFAQDAEWDGAEKAIVSMRAGLTQHTLAATKELVDSVAAELSYQYALWNSDFLAALEHCRTVIGKLNHPDLRGYRALWLYLAGSSAWLAFTAGQLDKDEIAKDYFRSARRHLKASRLSKTVTILRKVSNGRVKCILEDHHQPRSWDRLSTW